MSKKDQTGKKAKPTIVSISEIPFSAKEKRALQAILVQPHWRRRKMKDEFIAENRRLSKEVDAYIMVNGKRKKNKIEDSSGSMSEPEPKPKLTAKLKGGEPLSKGSGKMSEIRVPFKTMRVEDRILVIEFE